ncbi:hypothetical protein LR48_Vigan06g114700 [Vigna angularis]|uniref:RING-type E3 ubiquitin transferase n=1 Tax=Phaseolus angularis TaxID=3914 RepID=A0A0L9USY6_PHAAN|nr:hypothetical protein LR48_Vigan06g114700 [Vigna angularis]
MTSLGNTKSLVPYMNNKDCSQGFCSLYCPQWCYVIYPPPPPFEFPADDSSPNFSPLVIAVIGVLASAFLLVSYYTLISKYCGSRESSQSEDHEENVELEDDHSQHPPTITYNHIPHSSPIPTVTQPPHLLPPFSSSNFKFKFNHLQLSQEKPIHSTKPYPPKPIHPNKQKTKYASADSSILSTPTTYIHPLTTKNPKDQGCRLYQGDPRPWRPGWRCRRSRGPDRGSPVEVVSSWRLDRGSAVAAVARSDGAAPGSLGGGGSQYQSGANLPREKKRKGAWSGGRR